MKINRNRLRDLNQQKDLRFRDLYSNVDQDMEESSICSFFTIKGGIFPSQSGVNESRNMPFAITVCAFALRNAPDSKFRMEKWMNASRI